MANFQVLLSRNKSDRRLLQHDHLEKKVWQGKLNKFCNFNYAFISLRGFFKVFGIEKMKKRPSPPRIFDKWWKWKDGISANARFSFSIGLQSSNYWKMTCCSLDPSSSKNMIYHGGCPLPLGGTIFHLASRTSCGRFEGEMKWKGVSQIK